MSTPDPSTADDLALTTALGIKGYVDDLPLPQFVRWALETGLIRALIRSRSASAEQLSASTSLTPVGADVLMGVLVAIGLVDRDGPDGYATTDRLDALLDESSPFFLGESLTFATLPAPIPARFVRTDGAGGRRDLVRHQVDRLRWRALRAIAGRATSHSRGWDFGGQQRLLNQHQRNLPAASTAAALPALASADCVVDIGGGTGTFAIAAQRARPASRVVIADLPNALDGIRRFLSSLGASDIEVVGLDVLDPEWSIPPSDALFFGNLLHVFGDSAASTVLDRAVDHVRRSGGGVVVVHEVVWNEERTGPLKAALFDVTMRSFGGRQRTVAELEKMMRDAGCDGIEVEATLGGYVAVCGSVSA